MNSILAIMNKNKHFLYIADRMVSCFRRQKYFEAFDLAKDTINQLENIITDILQEKDYFENTEFVDNSNISFMLSGLIQAQECKNYVLLADLYEIQIIPYFIKLQEYICSRQDLVWDEVRFQVNISYIQQSSPQLARIIQKQSETFRHLDENYIVEYTSTGSFTLAKTTSAGKYYMHSNYMPLREADEIAETWFDKNKKNYSIWGLGLGYHVQALANISEYINIKVYESDIELIRMACSFSDIGEVLKLPNVQLIYEPEENKLLKKMLTKKDDGILAIHYPSMQKIKDNAVRETLEDFFIYNDAVQRYQYAMEGNFSENVRCYDETVDILEKNFKGKNLYIVAAGPSLDKNYLELKKINKNDIIIATGTVFRKLMKAGIRPNFVIGIDATKIIYQQIKNLENETIPLIGLSTVYKDFMKNYHGKKYIVFQNGFEKAEQFAEKMNYKLYQSGGSVSTLALDIGIRLGCKRIVFLGLDLAYPNGMLHTSDTDFAVQINTDSMEQVQDIYGNFIPTSKNMNIYRKWIEKRIQGVRGIDFIDATEGGAKIKGMKICKLLETIDDKY